MINESISCSTYIRGFTKFGIKVWNFKLKVLKYSRNCISQYILVAEVWHSLTYIVHTAMYKRGFNLLLLFVLFPWDIHISWRTTAPTKSPQGCVVIRRKLVELGGGYMVLAGPQLPELPTQAQWGIFKIFIKNYESDVNYYLSVTVTKILVMLGVL